jgi:hypothetical protein
MAFSATELQLKFQKYRIFGYFKANLGTSFFQNKIFAQNRPENIKIGFFIVSLRLQNDFYPIFNNF